jgi:hypothetical protein
MGDIPLLLDEFFRRHIFSPPQVVQSKGVPNCKEVIWGGRIQSEPKMKVHLMERRDYVRGPKCRSCLDSPRCR